MNHTPADKIDHSGFLLMGGSKPMKKGHTYPELYTAVAVLVFFCLIRASGRFSDRPIKDWSTNHFFTPPYEYLPYFKCMHVGMYVCMYACMYVGQF